jgi:ABC-2 type transport system ATP-binding protein
VPINSASLKSIIDVKGLTRRFGSLTAVNHVEFSVHQGEIFGFLGPNGAGKTTTVRMLTGIIDPTDGTAAIEDYDIRKQPLHARAHIGVVPDLSVWRNVMLMAELHGIKRRLRVEEGERLLETLGLGERKKHKARTLSKGLRQRLMLCTALVTRPRILFLDEPTSGLDVKSARLIREIVVDLNKKGLTVFLTTHNMAEANEMCSRVAIIDKGRIAAIDTPDKLRLTMTSRQYVDVCFTRAAPARKELNALPEVTQIEADGGVFRLYTPAPGHVLTHVIRLADKKGWEIADICSRKPSLEDVFLYITSKGGKGRGK